MKHTGKTREKGPPFSLLLFAIESAATFKNFPTRVRDPKTLWKKVFLEMLGIKETRGHGDWIELDFI